MDGLPAYLVGLVVLVFFSAFFSGTEAALFSLNLSQVNRLKKQSGPGREIAGLLVSPRRVLITILVGNLLVNVFSTSAATAVAVRMFGDRGVAIAFVFMSVLIMIFGEILPKTFALNQPHRFSLLVAYPLRFFHLLFYPVRAPITVLTDWVIGFLTRRLGKARRYFSGDELMTAFDIGRDQGNIGEFAHGLLSNIIDFRDTVVKEIMTPSISVFSLPVTMGKDEMMERILRKDVSRAPVYSDTPDDVLGVVHIKDLAAVRLEDPDVDLSSIIRPAHYVPESTRISELFKEMGRTRTQLALVIDEYGSFVGIVTMEDILEELVGEIRDAGESQATDYTLLDDKRIVVLGTMEIDAFNVVFGTDVVDDEHETIAGYVIGTIGEIPNEGATIDVDDLRFHIISAKPNRVRKMRVEKT